MNIHVNGPTLRWLVLCLEIGIPADVREKARRMGVSATNLQLEASVDGDCLENEERKLCSSPPVLHCIRILSRDCLRADLSPAVSLRTLLSPGFQICGHSRMGSLAK